MDMHHQHLETQPSITYNKNKEEMAISCQQGGSD